MALNPDYAPQSVNTDGWKGTQLAWKSLFPQITLMRCFLHTVLGIQQAMGRKCKALVVQKTFWSLKRVSM